MFSLTDSFRAYDENKQPYSFYVERHTETANLHAWVENDRFHLSSIGNRHILSAPAFTLGRFEMDFMFNYMDVFKTNFTVFFGYDEATRRGLGLKFVYDLDLSLEITLSAVEGGVFSPIATETLILPTQLKEELYSFSLNIGENRLSGTYAGAEFEIPCAPRRGKLALERHHCMGELIIDRIAFSTGDEIPRQPLVPKTEIDIPLVNGGDIPYTLSWQIDKIGDDAYLTAVFGGGTKTRPVNREDRPGQYVAEKDWMTSPYIGLTRGDSREVYSIANGERAFIDPNIFWDCQKALFGDTELPIVNCYKIPTHLVGEGTELLFGYEKLFCTGYVVQSGGSEFRYTLSGELIDYGPALDGRDVYSLSSQEDKLALDFVPNDCYKRDEVIAHIKNNHYFDVSESPRFAFSMQTKTDPDYLEISAAVLNVYESKTVHSFTPEIKISAGKFGYRVLSCEIAVPPMELGVWKLAFEISYCGKHYDRYVKTFEVFDRNLPTNPALASGLPFVFSMPNEQKRLMRNSFDLWNPAKSCDMEHYITCITDTPVEAETRRVWELIKPFKRKWFAWLSSRTCTDWQVENHMDTVKNADYLFASWQELFMDMSQSGLYPVRQDHQLYENFMNRESVRVEILNGFLSENPGIAENLDYRPGMKFTQEHFVQLLTKYLTPWVEYQNRRGHGIMREHNAQLRAINPNFKRSLYGPINSYVTPTLTGHSLKSFGHSDSQALAEDVFTGFCVFEDYPYACSYQTYRGAFIAMNILLESPNLRLYPEQYKGSKGGCIDGAVKNAHAPMGKYDVEGYQISTHSFEFVFNTSFRLPSGYRYWNTYGFHKGDHSEELMARQVLDWRHVVENKPARPLPTTAFLAKYVNEEDVFELTPTSSFINNASELGHGLVYECTREAGIPAGFAMKYESLENFDRDECDVLVLPSLAGADRKYVEKIRALYEAGVNLIAVSKIDGLEDIFGVAPDPHSARFGQVKYADESEYIMARDAEILYKPAGAQVIMTSDSGEALALATGRTLLLNTAVYNLGCSDSSSLYSSKSRFTVGELVRKMLESQLRRLSSPLALGENVGVTLFETQDGRKMLLCIDYTPFDNRQHGPRQAIVKLNLPGIKDVKCEKDIFVGRKKGRVGEIRFDILPHESVFVELI